MTKDESLDTEEEEERLREIEAQAVDKAKVTADAAFRPSPSILNAQSAAVLLNQVDGPSLATYDSKESIYVGRSLTVPAGGDLQVPIQVTTPGSIVEYSVELKMHDIVFEITAEREEGDTMVKEESKITVADSPVTQKFLVGTVPCMIQFRWDNSFSWMREKMISYKISVTPPTRDSLSAGRRRRATACLKAVRDDLEQAENRLTAATKSKLDLEQQVAELMKRVTERKKEWQVAEKEEAWLQERRALRVEQQRLLKQRLEHGWEDEDDAAVPSLE